MVQLCLCARAHTHTHTHTNTNSLIMSCSPNLQTHLGHTHLYHNLNYLLSLVILTSAQSKNIKQAFFSPHFNAHMQSVSRAEKKTQKQEHLAPDYSRVLSGGPPSTRLFIPPRCQRVNLGHSTPRLASSCRRSINDRSCTRKEAVHALKKKKTSETWTQR